MPSAKPLHEAQRTTASLGRSLVHFAADIKVVHSVFALPFAISALLVGRLPLPGVQQATLLLLCMILARSFAMGMNRFLDRRIDLANPRTSQRKIPKGDLTPQQGLGWSVLSGALFVTAAFSLSPLAGYCAAPLLVILAFYSLMKHVSWLTHLYLGICLGLAPVGVAIALTGNAPLPVLLVGLAVALWTAGFDVLYALQDRDFDRRHKLCSVPSRFGPQVTLWISRVCFTLMVLTLFWAGALSDRGVVYQVGVCLVAALLVYEHILVRDAREDGASKHLNLAFFNMNAYVSVLFLAFTVLDTVFWYQS